MLGIIGAMESEIRLLLGKMQEVRQKNYGRMAFYLGKIEGQDIVLMESGIGKVAAAIGAQVMIDRFGVSGLVNTGIAGGVGKGLCVGDIVVGSFAVQYDFDMSALGYAPGYMDGEEEDRPTRYMADEKLKKEFLKAAEKVMPAGHTHEGGIATGDRFASDAELGRRLREDFSCLAVEMEGGAIAQTAVQNQVPFVLVRSISDLADEQASASVEQFEQFAADRSAQILVELLKARR